MFERPSTTDDPFLTPGAPGPAGGVHAADTLDCGGDPGALFETLDLLPQRLALLAASGRLLRVNRWLAELLRRAPDHGCLEASLAGLARAVAAAERARADDARLAAPEEREIRLAGGRCRLWGWCVDLHRHGLGRCVLVTVQPAGSLAPPDHVLRERFGLTRKEVAVARLIAEGRSNTGIAAALCISPHTARHHTERIMAKLGARSRAEVSPRLQGIGAERPEDREGRPGARA